VNKLEAMHIFVRVAELASFTKAAETLGIPKATASTAVQQLESGIGARLLHRTTRTVQMTQDGQAYYERCKELLADLDDIESMFEQRPQALRGRLRVDMPSGIARNVVIPNLPSFLDQHPLLEVELSSTDRRVDPVSEGFDCVLRVGPVGEHNWVVRTLGRLKTINCGSAAYVEKYGMPVTIEDLAHHKLIHYVSTLGAKSLGWEYPQGAGYGTTAMHGAVTVNNVEAYESACLAGLGLIQAPAVALQELVAEGRLVEVLSGFPAEPMPVSLLYANRRNLPQRVRAFMNWMAATLQPLLI
jgi:DNA-binding transcriptional LysR family regulator